MASLAMNSQSPSSGFPPTYPRPQWLLRREELEGLLLSFEIQISDLRTNKNNSALVERVLEKILAYRESENSLTGYKIEDGSIGLQYEPDSYELLLARLHLAIEIQSILVDWCSRGMDETRKTSLLGRGSLSGDDGEAVAMEGDVAVGRSRSASQSSACNASIRSVNTAMTTPRPTERATKRRNFGMDGHAEIHRPPRLSLVTTEPLILATGPDSAYPSTESASTYCASAKRKYAEAGFSGYSMTPSSAVFSAQPISPQFFGAGQPTSSPGSATYKKGPFFCPYHFMNPNDERHKVCATETFPNPRKLKEHVWRFTKPFKCPKCGDGFGRDKTRALHLEKKVPCKPRPATEYDEGSGNYEGSREQLRDRKIDTAKSSIDIVHVLREYEQGTELSAGNTRIAAAHMQGVTFQDPFSSQRQQVDQQHMISQVPHYMQGLGLDLPYESMVPKIVVQSYDMQATLTAAHCDNSYNQPKGLETQGWKPMGPPGLPSPATPPRKHGRPQSQTNCNLTPPNQRDNTTGTTQDCHGGLIMSSPKSPTPELTHNGPSPVPSPDPGCSGPTQGELDEQREQQEYVIYDSPLTTPSINISYWQQKAQAESLNAVEPGQGAHAASSQGRGAPAPMAMVGAAAMVPMGLGMGMVGGMQRKVSGSFDQLAYTLLEDIDSLWDNGGFTYH